MFWLSKPFSLEQIRQYLAFSGLEVTTDQNGRLVVYVADNPNDTDASEMLKQVIRQFRLNTNPIPCDERSRLFVCQKLNSVCC